jgi:hypothetical protein
MHCPCDHQRSTLATTTYAPIQHELRRARLEPADGFPAA